jgi:hypothetical protein
MESKKLVEYERFKAEESLVEMKSKYEHDMSLVDKRMQTMS